MNLVLQFSWGTALYLVLQLGWGTALHLVQKLGGRTALYLVLQLKNVVASTECCAVWESSVPTSLCGRGIMK